METKETPKDEERRDAVSLRSVSYVFILIGGVCLSYGHTFIDNFMLQIMTSVGGTTAHMGAALAIASLVELPAMMVFDRLCRKTNVYRLLILSAVCWIVRNMMVLISGSVWLIYLAEALQCVTYAFYVPAVVQVIRQILPKDSFSKGIALQTSAYTVGSVLATLIGGFLLDEIGIKGALIIVCSITVLGTFNLLASFRTHQTKTRSS